MRLTDELTRELERVAALAAVAAASAHTSAPSNVCNDGAVDRINCADYNEPGGRRRKTPLKFCIGGYNPLSRALNKRASTVLFSWLSDHLHHPYPTKEEKAVLCRNADISTTQLRNWFTNVRCDDGDTLLE